MGEGEERGKEGEGVGTRWSGKEVSDRERDSRQNERGDDKVMQGSKEESMKL